MIAFKMDFVLIQIFQIQIFVLIVILVVKLVNGKIPLSVLAVEKITFSTIINAMKQENVP
jgi:hypothetical protein